MELNSKILSEITTHMKYAKYVKEFQRRETWEEIVTRNMNMHMKKFPEFKDMIWEAYSLVYKKEILPSMRGLQFGGTPIEVNPARQYNCCFLHMDHYKAFSEVMFLLLSGTGVGYSVQFNHIAKLPDIKKPKKERRYLVEDSIQGWADAVNILIKSYYFGSSKPRFDFSQIRQKGAELVTSGGKAPGPEPLKQCLFQIEQILDTKKDGEKLSSLEIHDINCHIADAVLSGGIRRAAMISLFSFDDEEMLTCKFGNWWELNPQRGRSNNSAVILRHRIKQHEFFNLWSKIQASGSGEPGFFFSNNADWGLNPCAEVSLRSNQFCNLVTINGGNIKDQADLNYKAAMASFIGTLQASYTDFIYLRDSWKTVTEKEALIGVSITGIASGNLAELNLTEAAEKVVETNRYTAEKLRINPAARCTVIKPEGTSSLVLGTSSGIHDWHDEYFIRRIRVGKNEAIYTYLSINHPELIEDEFFKPNQQAVISVPVAAPNGAYTRTNQTALDLLQRVKLFHDTWIKGGHNSGENTNNVSATITIRPDEWNEVGEWLWNNKYSYTALSFLPYSDHTYKQAPFETIDYFEFERLSHLLKDVNLENVIEMENNVSFGDNIACGGGSCELI